MLWQGVVYIELHYNKSYHGKGPMDGVGGTVKNAVFSKVKFGNIAIYSPKEFVDYASQLVPLIKTVLEAKDTKTVRIFWLL